MLSLCDMARPLVSLPAASATSKLFLVAAPTRAMLVAWAEEAHKFDLAPLLATVEFTTYRSLPKVLAAGRYHKRYLSECHALKDSHELGLRAHVAHHGHILSLTGTPPPTRTERKPGY